MRVFLLTASFVYISKLIHLISSSWDLRDAIVACIRLILIIWFCPSMQNNKRFVHISSANQKLKVISMKESRIYLPVCLEHLLLNVGYSIPSETLIHSSVTKFIISIFSISMNLPVFQVASQQLPSG